jgi:anaerobic magnesium-protoporphyrin IX monomethyl ester cyclase
MKTLLVLPPFNRLHGIEKGYFPLGLGYLAAVLARNDLDVRIYNAEMTREKQLSSVKYSGYDEYYQNYVLGLKNDDHPVWQEAASTLRSAAPDLVGLSVMTAKYASAMKMTEIVKRTCPSALVVWGGPHPTIQPDEVLQSPNVDFVVRGEGEETFLELCLALSGGSGDFSDIKGLCYKRGGEIRHNTLREPIRDLDGVPLPARHLDLNPGLYTPYQMSAIMGTRGCPYDCAYCASRNTWGRTVRYRSAGNIVEEIDHIAERYDSGHFFFWDDNFTLSRKWTLDLCRALIANKRKVTFGINTRVDLVDRDVLSALKGAGLVSIDFGIETGSPRMLRLLNRKMTVEEMHRAFKLCKQLGIGHNAYVMLGFPEETEEDMQLTIDLVDKIKPDFSGLSIFTPYPGTSLYEKAKELDLLSEPMDWSRFSHQSPENHFVKHVEKARFREIASSFATRLDRRNRFNFWNRRMRSAARHPVRTGRKVLSRLQRHLPG